MHYAWHAIIIISVSQFTENPYFDAFSQRFHDYCVPY
jgi:hypothetical protein